MFAFQDQLASNPGGGTDLCILDSSAVPEDSDVGKTTMASVRRRHLAQSVSPTFRSSVDEVVDIALALPPEQLAA
ncbi:hypothetical protein BPAE_0112g00310 [Botrytis paeoniae]|uniref:Uncharacterized protein n=1 Tax=Botrytis paeoniae TaxID=278948 RepID=A0A4Z1FMR4_9HELO|nr:hypothetical protein BPAE_0112g00310 [Botrytis paeoniae]